MHAGLATSCLNATLLRMMLPRRDAWIDAVLTLLPGAAIAAALIWPWTRPALAAATIAAGLPFFVATIRGALDRRVAAEAFPSMALGLLLWSGEWTSAAAVSLLLGGLRWAEHLLETRALARVERPLRELGTLLPAGASALVQAGGRIPGDGVVTQGAAFVDERMVRGESEPAERLPGDPVFAGSVVRAGSIGMRATQAPEDALAMRLHARIRHAAARPSPTEHLAGHASAFSYWLLGLAAAATWFFVREPLHAAAVLLVLRPDALVAATSLAASLAVAAAGRLGALVPGGEALDRLATADVAVFDKSRAVSFAEIRVGGVDHDPGVSDAYVWECVAVAEAGSDHPVGRALYREAVRRIGRIREADTCRAVPGRGVIATLGGRLIAIGTAELHRDSGTSFEGAWLAGSTSPVDGRVSDCFLALDGACVARFRIEERPRQDIRTAIEGLRLLGFERDILFTPDTVRIAAKQAEAAGLADYRPSVTPEERWRELGRLSKERRILLIGDGEDAAAVARAHAAVALSRTGGRGGEDACVTLHADALGTLPRLVRLGRAFHGVVRVQVGIWIIAGSAGLALAAMGALSPLAAAAYALTTSLTLHVAARGLGSGRGNAHGQPRRKDGQ